jgi:hypothetical protein
MTAEAAQHWKIPKVIRKLCSLDVHQKGKLCERECALNFHKKEKRTCGRKEKQESEIGQDLSLGKRKKEKNLARRKSWADLKNNSPDRLR